MATVATRMPQAIHTVHPDRMEPDNDAERTFTKSLAAAKPLTLQSLLEQPVEFVDPRIKQDDDTVPYTPINLAVRSFLGILLASMRSPSADNVAPLAFIICLMLVCTASSSSRQLGQGARFGSQYEWVPRRLDVKAAGGWSERHPGVGTLRSLL